MHDPANNMRSFPTQYMVDQELINLDMEGQRKDKIILHYAFPTSVGDMSLDYSSNEPMTFDVTYKYLYSLHEAGS